MTCPIPASHRDKSPVAVSLVEHGCDNATNHLRVIHNKLEEGSDKKLFAVCSKGHTFPDEDKSVEIVEWIEIIRSMGADIFMYHFDIHPNISKVNLNFDPKSLKIIFFIPKVLDHYSNKDYVDVTHVTVPGPDFNIPILQFQYLMGNYPQDRC